MTQVKVRHPGLSVKVFKNVGRSTIDGSVPVSTRFSGQKRSIDLVPHLGEHGNVSVTKSVREPAGAFSIALTDQIDSDAQDSLYGLIEPMDVVEIRMASDAYKSVGELPIMMRGFVSNVKRDETMQPDGKPIRRVIVTGQDYGKIWQILQIFFLPNAPQGENYLTSFPFFARFGLTFNTMPANQFVREVFEKVVNPYIQEMGGQGGNDPAASPLLAIVPDIQIQDGVVSPFGVGGWSGGSIYELLSQHCDIGAWNELYIEDRSDAPYVVYRPNPFKAIGTGKLIQSGAREPETIDITRSDIVKLEAGRSDAHVANYFWVDAPRFTLNYSDTARAFAFNGAPETFYVQNYGNVNPKLYGMRKMWEQTQQGGSSEKYNGNGTPAGSARQVDAGSALDWMTARRVQLIDQNKDNVMLEQGSMRIKGNESIRAGKYLKYKHGNMTSEYYCVSVTHDFVPFQTYQTTVMFERGTGFVDRVQKGTGIASPYWSELSERS